MGYNKINYRKKVKHALEVYKMHKNDIVSDAYIVRVRFPQHGINICYTTWMLYKNIKPSELE